MARKADSPAEIYVAKILKKENFFNESNPQIKGEIEWKKKQIE